MRSEILEVLTAIFLTFFQSPIPEPEQQFELPSIRPAAAATHARAAEAVAHDPERFLVKPFLIADRETRQITVWGQMTGMVLGDAVEFFVITELSGQDYESLLISWVRPSHLHAALEFIGLEAIGPVDPEAKRFWPRGDRVDAYLELIFPEEEAPRRIPAHEWITRPNGAVMEYMPWVFTGAVMLPSLEDPDELVYAPDLFSPNSIASTFNLRNTVFDLPVQGAKSVVYGDFRRNPALVTVESQPVLLHLRPANPERIPVEAALNIHLSAEEIRVEGFEALEGAHGSLAAFAEQLAPIENTHFFATLHFADELTLKELFDKTNALDAIIAASPHLRIDPPPPGHVYYQTFSPPQQFRNRENRPSQPWELHLHRAGDGYQATRFVIQELWGDARRPQLIPQRDLIESPEAWAEAFRNTPPQFPVLFVFAPADVTHATLMEWIRPVLPQLSVIYVYNTLD